MHLSQLEVSNIPRKNLLLINNKPLISYTLELCQKIPIQDVLVSTDDEEIITFSRQYGYETEYRRPPNLAEDHSPIVDSVIHGVEWYQKNKNRSVDNIMLLQPTSPIREVSDLKSSLSLFFNKNLESLVSVTSMYEHPFECIELTDDCKWNYLRKPRCDVSRRQDYVGKYGFIDGSFYLVKYDFLKKNKKFVVEGTTFPFFTSQKFPFDIDEENDCLLVESLMKIHN